MIMIRALGIPTVVILNLVAWPRDASAQNPNACKLLSAAEASNLVGTPLALRHQQSNSSFATCDYGLPDPAQLASVEVSYAAWPDANTAHMRFTKRVQPGAKPSPLSTVIPVTGLGDEAAIKQSPSLKQSSIEVRQGMYVVSFGVMPNASDTALKTAARRALTRLP
jgi:hypothetical protein